jgi:phosphoserine phosphatase RsbU/P
MRIRRRGIGDDLACWCPRTSLSRGDYDEGEARLVVAARRQLDNPAQTMATEIVRDMHDVVRHRDDTLLLALRYLRPSAS